MKQTTNALMYVTHFWSLGKAFDMSAKATEGFSQGYRWIAPFLGLEPAPQLDSGSKCAH